MTRTDAPSNIIYGSTLRASTNASAASRPDDAPRHRAKCVTPSIDLGCGKSRSSCPYSCRAANFILRVASMSVNQLGVNGCAGLPISGCSGGNLELQHAAYVLSR